jgi:hypothetical protein
MKADFTKATLFFRKIDVLSTSPMEKTTPAA